MSSTPGRAEGRGAVALHVVTLTTLLMFGCTTVRAPVSAIGPTVPVHGSTAEPQVELWLESAGDPTPAESARAIADAQAALRQALQDRSLWDDEVLVVRAQAVSRTSSHRAEQHAAIAGIVVGAVVIVALAVVAARGHGNPFHGVGGHVHASPFRPGAVPHSGGFRPGAVPVRPVVPRAPPPRVAPPSGPGGVDVYVDVAVETPPNDAGPPVEAFAGEAPPAPDYFIAPPTERISAVTLPAPSPLSTSSRGFFDGDWVRLELVVVDAWTGAVHWTKTVTEEVDVRDVHKIRRVIDDALATEDGWYTPFSVAR